MSQERDAVREALRVATDFIDVTVRGWISEMDDEHTNCSPKECRHRAYYDEIFDKIEERAIAGAATLAAHPAPPATACTHSYVERECAVADGMCPLCLAAEFRRAAGGGA